MEFLRKATQAASEDFKELADEIWENMGDTSGVPKEIKEAGRTMGKYAIASQLAMMFNFPDDADLFRDSFNVTGDGPTGMEFTGIVGALLDNSARIATQINEQAISMQGFADIASTSTFDDIRNMLPELIKEAKETKPTKRGK